MTSEDPRTNWAMAAIRARIDWVRDEQTIRSEDAAILAMNAWEAGRAWCVRNPLPTSAPAGSGQGGGDRHIIKDHLVAAMVNSLTKVAQTYGQTQQLRERISHLVCNALSAQHSTAEPVAWRWQPSQVYDDWVFSDIPQAVNAGRAHGRNFQPLFAAPQQAPLTAEQVRGIVKDAGFDDAPATARAAFISGLRHGEAAHGISAAKETR